MRVHVPNKELDVPSPCQPPAPAAPRQIQPIAHRRRNLASHWRRSFCAAALTWAAWLALSVGLGLGTPASANAQSLAVMQQAFVITGRSGINNNLSQITGTLTLQATGQQTLSGPMTLVLDGLNPAITLNDASGVTADGRPYLNLPATTRFVPGTPVTLNLAFKLPRTMASITTLGFTARLTQVRPPPAPNTASLLGPDLNRDGIRDDLEPIIQARYRDTPKMLAAAKQQLRAMQSSLAATQSASDAFNAVLVLNKSLDCVMAVLGVEAGAAEIHFLRGAALNTKERVLAWLASAELLAGQVAPGSGSEPCEP